MAGKGSGRSTANRRIIRGILVGGILLAVPAWVVWMALPKWKDKAPESPPLSLPESQIRRAQFRVDGMDCIVCAAGLQNTLRTLPGVLEAEVSYQDGRAVVHFDPARMDAVRIEKAIEDAGFSPAREDILH